MLNGLSAANFTSPYTLEILSNAVSSQYALRKALPVMLNQKIPLLKVLWKLSLLYKDSHTCSPARAAKTSSSSLLAGMTLADGFEDVSLEISVRTMGRTLLTVILGVYLSSLGSGTRRSSLRLHSTYCLPM